MSMHLTVIKHLDKNNNRNLYITFYNLWILTFLPKKEIFQQVIFHDFLQLSTVFAALMFWRKAFHNLGAVRALPPQLSVVIITVR